MTIVQIRHISQTAGGPPLDSGHMRKKILLFILLDELFIFAHYNIQADIVSSRPCVTSVRNHGTHI